MCTLCVRVCIGGHKIGYAAIDMNRAVFNVRVQLSVLITWIYVVHISFHGNRAHACMA